MSLFHTDHESHESPRSENMIRVCNFQPIRDVQRSVTGYTVRIFVKFCWIKMNVGELSCRRTLMIPFLKYKYIGFELKCIY